MTKIKERNKPTTIKEYNRILNDNNKINTNLLQEGKHTYTYAQTHTVNHLPTNKYQF